MKTELTAAYHDVDFLLPVHRFNIRFSYVTNKGLPFIREFILRLLHISPMTKLQIANYFGLSANEIEEAISDLMKRGEVQFIDSGKLGLTFHSRNYFISLGFPPQLSTVMETGGVFSFELISFYCVGKGRTNEKWSAGIALQANNENIANSEKNAQISFQHQFYEILEKGFIPQVRNNEAAEKPSIYTVESVNKLGQEPIRLSVEFRIDEDGMPVERADFNILTDSSLVHESITSTLSNIYVSSNIPDIASAMNLLEDKETQKFLTNNSVDLRLLSDSLSSENLDNYSRSYFLGPIYKRDNWKSLVNIINDILNSDSNILDFIWVAPSDVFWGKSLKWLSCVEDFFNQAASNEKKVLYSPKLFLPICGEKDKKGIKDWRKDLKSYDKGLYGLLEGLLNGCVEILLIPGKLAVICYHIRYPNALPVTLPLGFFTKELDVISKVEKVVNEYLVGFQAFDKPNNLGLLKDLVDKN
ncbi:MAG: hypothetical protein L3K52_13645 [Candidatus Thiothrix sulfatifontis]|nr:MAG: hypothetical protein L3K52_13645 [Candidatus Thiothrix sulfatifontis]